jgi:hypothetical protein
MKQLSFAELVETLRVWQSEGVGLCVLATLRQFVFGAARFDELTEQRISITLTKVVERVELSPELEVTAVVFGPEELVSALHSTTFNLKNAGLLTEHYDETLQLGVHGHVLGVTVYRATAFRRRERESAV